ncbi:sulfite exporter TauE/SafE family protein [Puniceibacterium sp. IMCC21224]|uniref:sulfite exporter TauE/SafE family protein n=1 Tax=Puniceibacterium sp. IMCC21224 TaxID=1618204 RepID=UPI00064D9C16|nr:sulfite exporter TauE/SafE family protein [Puniceibacterium sp. IMCC21224]KMK66349.1 putative permease [Puniceibacterium sp. IMCC21224]
MELINWATLMVAIPAVIFAGVSKGGFGSGAAFAAASILALVLEPGQALGIMLPLLMLIDAASLRAYWKKWSWPDAKVLILGMVPGTVLGALFYARADPDSIRLLIGVISLAFVGWQMAQKAGLMRLSERRLGPRAGLLAGVGIGITSFISHAGGPVAAVYLLGQKLPKTTYQATTVLVFWAVNLFKFSFYAVMGILTFDTLGIDLVLAPFAILGTWIGIRIHKIVPEMLFFGLTYVLLSITGVKLIWDAIG